jgi:hypothetical protein
MAGTRPSGAPVVAADDDALDGIQDKHDLALVWSMSREVPARLLREAHAFPGAAAVTFDGDSGVGPCPEVPIEGPTWLHLWLAADKASKAWRAAATAANLEPEAFPPVYWRGYIEGFSRSQTRPELLYVSVGS